MDGWGLVAAGEVGVLVGVGVSVAPVLASQSVAVEASGRHHITLGVPAVCKAASPRIDLSSEQVHFDFRF